MNFVAKLLQGDRAVLSLLRVNPFAAAPPRFVRARLYRYRFSTAAERKQTGAWWQRELTANGSRRFRSIRPGSGAF